LSKPHFDPGMNGVDLKTLSQSRRDQILACEEPQAFEKEVHKLVAELKTSHTGFRHTGMRNIPARHAINATSSLRRQRERALDVPGCTSGRPDLRAGIRLGDLLLGCGGREVRSPDDLTFSVGESASLLIEKLKGGLQRVNVQRPMSKSQKHPVTAPEAVHARKLTDEIGLLKVTMFPGAIGIDVAKDIDRGISALDGC
jgi:carboxyl-terminal processing protease